jgi:biotin-(acetyl-CoA carboxylase) ligase
MLCLEQINILSHIQLLRSLSHFFTKSIVCALHANKDLYWINKELKLKSPNDVQYRTNKITYLVESVE